LLVRNDFWIYKIAKQLAVRFEYVYFAVCHAAAILEIETCASLSCFYRSENLPIKRIGLLGLMPFFEAKSGAN
jgi:hypothetical protein